MKSENGLLHLPSEHLIDDVWAEIVAYMDQKLEQDSTRLSGPQQRAAQTLRNKIPKWTEDLKNEQSTESLLKHFRDEISYCLSFEFKPLIQIPDIAHLTSEEQASAREYAADLQQSLETEIEKYEEEREQNVRVMRYLVETIEKYEYHVTHRALSRYAADKMLECFDGRYRKFEISTRKRKLVELTEGDFGQGFVEDRGSPNGPSAEVRDFI
jgi:hypothetical protein